MDWHIVEVVMFVTVVISSVDYIIYCRRYGFRVICVPGVLSLILWSVLLMIYPIWCLLILLALVGVLTLVIKDNVVNE